MEHRRELEEILLSGLPADEREHVLEVIEETTMEKLRRLREQDRDQLHETTAGRTADQSSIEDDDVLEAI